MLFSVCIVCRCLIDILFVGGLVLYFATVCRLHFLNCIITVVCRSCFFVEWLIVCCCLIKAFFVNQPIVCFASCISFEKFKQIKKRLLLLSALLLLQWFMSCHCLTEVIFIEWAILYVGTVCTPCFFSKKYRKIIF